MNVAEGTNLGCQQQECNEIGVIWLDLVMLVATKILCYDSWLNSLYESQENTVRKCECIMEYNR